MPPTACPCSAQGILLETPTDDLEAIVKHERICVMPIAIPLKTMTAADKPCASRSDE